MKSSPQPLRQRFEMVHHQGARRIRVRVGRAAGAPFVGPAHERGLEAAGARRVDIWDLSDRDRARTLYAVTARYEVNFYGEDHLLGIAYRELLTDRYHRECQNYHRECHQHVHDALEHQVEAAAEVGAGNTEDEAERRADEGRDETD